MSNELTIEELIEFAEWKVARNHEVGTCDRMALELRDARAEAEQLRARLEHAELTDHVALLRAEREHDEARARVEELEMNLSRVEAQRDAIAGLADERLDERDAARARLAQVEAEYANVMARYNSDAQIILKVGRLVRLIDTNDLRGLPHWLRDAFGSLVDTVHGVMDQRPAAQPDEGRET